MLLDRQYTHLLWGSALGHNGNSALERLNMKKYGLKIILYPKKDIVNFVNDYVCLLSIRFDFWTKDWDNYRDEQLAVPLFESDREG